MSSRPHLAWLLAVVGCSNDLLHATNWATRCDIDENAPGCGGGSATATGAGGAGGTGGSGGVPSTGGGGTGGTSAADVGGGGAGGEAPCQTCSEFAMGADPNLRPCPDSQAEIDALVACICMVCVLECEMECAGGQPMGDVCIQCAQQMAASGCPQELQACLADSG